MEPYWREAQRSLEGGDGVVEALLGVDEEHPAGFEVEEHEDDEPGFGPHVQALGEEFARHFAVHGVLPPAELAERMFATARGNDEVAEERAAEAGGDGGAHWRTSLGDPALVEAMLGSEAA